MIDTHLYWLLKEISRPEHYYWHNKIVAINVEDNTKETLQVDINKVLNAWEYGAIKVEKLEVAEIFTLYIRLL